MSLHLTKYEVINTLEIAIDFYKKFNKDVYPSFNVEYWYVESFIMHFSRFPVDEDENFIPVVTKKFKAALDLYSNNIIKLLDSTIAEANIIREEISRKEFIRKREQRTYNRQVSAPAPQLDRRLWMNYNNWILSNAFWEGVILSLQPGFKYIPPNNAYGAIEQFAREETKPLLGMNMKAREVHLPIIDESLDNFIVIPTRSFGEYFNEKKEKKTGK